MRARVREDTDLTYTDRAPLKSARGELWQSLAWMRLVGFGEDRVKVLRIKSDFGNRCLYDER